MTEAKTSAFQAVQNLPAKWTIPITILLAGGGATALENFSGASTDPQVMEDIAAMRIEMAELPIAITKAIDEVFDPLEARLRQVELDFARAHGDGG